MNKNNDFKRRILRILILGCMVVFLSTIIPIKRSIDYPLNIADENYIVYYDYYSNGWAIIDANCIDIHEIGVLKIKSGADPRKELSNDIWQHNSFLIQGKLVDTVIYEDSVTYKEYVIISDRWDILNTVEHTGIRRIVKYKPTPLTI